MSDRGRRRSQSTSKTSKDEPIHDNNKNKHPRIEIDSLKLDETTTQHDMHSSSLEAAGRSPSFKLRMIGNYCVERTIGRGQFGKVKLAYHKKLPDMKVAIKIINKTKLDEDTLKMIQREVHIMKLLQHPNIIRLYEVLETPRTFYLIMEYAEGGEVMDFIIAHGKIPEREAKRFFAQMLSAVQYCHSKKCCHRDLKPENLLLDSNMNVKIIDFGLSNMYVPGSLMKTFCGSPTYASPELILRKEYLGPPVDVWSMGVVLFVLVCGYLPFDGHNFVDLFNKILKAQYTIPSHVSPACASLLERMLVVEPDQRATIDEIRRHPWLSSVQDCLPDVQQIEITEASRANQAILSELEMLGYDKNEVVHALVNNVFSDAAAMYYLIDSKKYQARRGSVSTYASPLLSNSMPSPTSPMTPSTPPFSLSPNLSVSPNLSPPPSPPHTPNTLTTSKSVRNDEKKVGFNITTRIGERGEKGEKEKEKEKGRNAAVHRRAASEAMKEQVLKQAKAQHEMLKLAQYSTPQTKAANFSPKDDRESNTPPLHHISTAPIRHSMAIGAYDTNNWSPPSHPADIYKSNVNNNNNNNNNNDESGVPPPSPNSSKMASLLSSFKSMWRHKDKERDNKSKSGESQPRVVRFAFHVSTMTEKGPDLVVASIQSLLKEQDISFTMKGDFCANCVVDNVRFSVEVCRLPRLSVNGVRFSRISGSAWKYKTIVKDLVPLLKV